MYALVMFFQITNSNSINDSVLGKDTSGNLTDRLDRNLLYLNHIQQKPFGDIDFQRDTAWNPGFVGTAAIVGGYPLLLILATFLTMYFHKIINRLKRSRLLVLYISLISFFVPGLWDLQFYETYFVFIFVYFTTLIRFEMNGEELTAEEKAQRLN